MTIVALPTYPGPSRARVRTPLAGAPLGIGEPGRIDDVESAGATFQIETNASGSTPGTVVVSQRGDVAAVSVKVLPDRGEH